MIKRLYVGLGRRLSLLATDGKSERDRAARVGEARRLEVDS